MNREPFTIGSYVHVVKRGARGLPIFRNDSDRWRCLLMFNHFNDRFHSENWFRELRDEKIERTFRRSSSWPVQQPIVSLLAFTLMPNHLHILLKETNEGGIATFMGKLGKGMTLYANIKYREQGSMFQGPYRSRTLKDDTQFRIAAMYVMVKNPFELYRGGLERAAAEFDEAYEQPLEYPYSSLIDFNGKSCRPFIEKDLLGELFPTPRSFRQFAQEYIQGRSREVAEHDIKIFE